MNTTTKKEQKGNKYLIPLMLCLAVIPLVTHYVEFENNMSGFTWFFIRETLTDMSLYWRSIFFMILGLVMAVVLVSVLARKKRLERTVTFSYLSDRMQKGSQIVLCILLAYGILAMISSLLSDYREFAFWGTYGVYQGIFVVLSYCVLTCYAYVFVRGEADVKKVIAALVVGMSVICLIGMTQFFSHDFFQTEFGQSLILPSNMVGTGALDFKRDGDNLVYSTLLNPNYVGTYVVLCAPVLFISVIFIWKKLIRKKGAGESENSWKTYTGAVLGALLFVMLLLCLLGSQSRAGILVLGAVGIFMIILYRKSLFASRKVGLFVILLLAVLGTAGLFLANKASSGVLFTRISNMFSGVFAETQADGTKKTGNYMITDIQTNDKDVTFVYNGEKLTIQFDLQGDPENEHAFHVTDGAGKVIDYEREGADSSYYRLKDERFPECYLSIVNFESEFPGFGFMLMTVEHSEKGDIANSWIFSNENPDGDGTYYFCNKKNGRFIKLSKWESADLFKDAFVNNRGYIWNHTLPMLKDHILLGSGANTFVFEFPNDDYLGLYNSGHMDEYVDKPHNMYLQMFVESGGLSLAVFLVFYLIYFVQSIRIYWKRKLSDYLPAIGAAVFAGSIGYMLIGFVNDGMLVTAPVFYALIGLGFAINQMVNKAEEGEGNVDEVK